MLLFMVFAVPDVFILLAIPSCTPPFWKLRVVFRGVIAFGPPPTKLFVKLLPPIVARPFDIGEG